MTFHLGPGMKKADGPLQISGEKLHELDKQFKVLPETILWRGTIAGVLFTLLLTGFMSLLTWQSTRQGEEDTDWVVHTLAVQKTLQSAVGLAVNLEAEARGFAETGDEAFLDPKKDQQRELAQDLDSLNQLTADNAVQQERRALLASQVNTSMQFAEKFADERRVTGEIPAVTELLADKRLMDAVKATAAAMQGTETQLLTIRTGKMHEARKLAGRLALLGALIGVAFLMLAGAILLHQIKRLALMQSRLRALNAELEKLAADLEDRVVERTRQLETTMVELRHKNEEVEAFVYIVSHDLRAPLVNLMGFARELQASCAMLKKLLEPFALPEASSAAISEILETELPSSVHFISQSSLKFERLIDALLNLSRYGREIYRVAQVDVEEVVTNAVANFHQAITEAAATVEVGTLPTVRADLTALGQVFANLIGNSLKYRSPDRPLRLEVGGAIEDGTVNYWVRDNGLGIPEAGKSRLFQVFQRFHPQQAEGEGMGLAIAHRIVERHGGRIWSESLEGEGTTFAFSIPDNAGSSVLSSTLDGNQRAN